MITHVPGVGVPSCYDGILTVCAVVLFCTERRQLLSKYSLGLIMVLMQLSNLDAMLLVGLLNH